jgi:UDP-glucuronate 4-epimerase
MYPMQQGDVPRTFANVDVLIKDYKYSPTTDIKFGIEKFINWYKYYYY